MPQCEWQNPRMKRCSILPRAPTTLPPRWENGTGWRSRKRNQSCIRPSNARNLMAMSFQCAAEQAAWREVKEGWRPLYGDVDSMGVAVEWHDFRMARAFNWGRTFHPRSLEFCLNLEGRGEVGVAGKTTYEPGNSGYYAISDEPLPASRRAHDRHQFVTLEFSRAHLRRELVQNVDGLEPEIRRIIFDDKNDTVVAPVRPMSIEQRNVIASLADPPVAKAAQILWYQSKALELMAHFLFPPKDPEFFCMRQKRVARERVERAKEILARDLVSPPTL